MAYKLYLNRVAIKKYKHQTEEPLFGEMTHPRRAKSSNALFILYMYPKAMETH